MREKKNERNLRKPQTVVRADWSSSNLQSKQNISQDFQTIRINVLTIVQLNQTKCDEKVQLFDAGIGYV